MTAPFQRYAEGHFRPNRLSTVFMFLAFRLRDLVNPPAKKVAEAGLRKGQSVLDFGCGPGAYAVAAAKSVGETGMVFALDINPLAVKTVARQAVKNKLHNIKTICSDGDTGLADQSVDVVFLYDIYHMLDERERVLAEIRRVLKPKGVLSFSDHHMKDPAITGDALLNTYFTFIKKEKHTFLFYLKS